MTPIPIINAPASASVLGPDYLSTVPFELIVKICAFLQPHLNADSITALGQTNRRLRAIISDPTFPSSVVREYRDHAIGHFAFRDSVNLKKLREYGNQFSSEESFKLDLSSSNVTDAELESIVRRFPNIVEINARGCRLSNAAAPHLALLTNLRNLDLMFCPMTIVGRMELSHALGTANIT